VSPWLGVLLAYVLGATPTSQWLAQAFYGVDLRRRGSGNLGATNAFRVLGARAAVPVMVIDALKGWVPAWFFPLWDTHPGTSWALAYAAAAVLGHVFSFWVGFRGGKGIATSAGAFLGLAPLAAGFALAVWLIALAVGRIVSLASLCAAVALPFAVWFTEPQGGRALLGFAVLVSGFAFWTHRANVKRLLRGEEHRFGTPKTSTPPEEGNR